MFNFRTLCAGVCSACDSINFKKAQVIMWIVVAVILSLPVSIIDEF